MRLPLSAALTGAALLLGGCTPARRSGFAPVTFHAPPFHAGRAVAADAAPVAHLPVAFQRGANDPATFEPDPAKDMGLARLLADIDAELDALGMSRRVSAGAIPVRGAPDVIFGCRRESPMGDCVEEAGGMFGGTRRPFELKVDAPESRWLAAARAAVGDPGARLLVITLEIGEYPLREAGVRGRPSVDLGTRHRETLPALQNTDTPLQVLQLTGVMLGPDGKALRAGAEGIFAKRPHALLGALGVQALFSDEDFRRIRELCRDDLPGQPLAWKVALRELVSGLLERRVPST